ncbi:unnamed protein product [Psylliodes chrysocephalus]|uniref:Uncharacterized protein n=1 Tax=Psylliodes chrysocephalus TaxID=3402493 RepID=A0A9P0DA67_9CUCU|nr:unnamed protein product [Psylliodes chrysocephala]
MDRFRKLFNKRCSVIGMVHLQALPGCPLFSGSVNKIVEKACEETELYLKHDIDGILVENMHDIPYIQSKYFGPEVTSTMTRICTEIRKLIPETKPFGVQVLACGNREALAIAKACSMNFVRAEGFVFSHVADEGFTDANAGLILRYRKQIQAEDVLVFTDIKKKHSSHAITNDISLLETAKAAEYFLSNGLILTGTATGHAADVQELKELKSNIDLPVLIGSGVTIDNVEKYISADALIVGSYFKKHGKWDNDIDEERLSRFMKKIKNCSH